MGVHRALSTLFAVAKRARATYNPDGGPSIFRRALSKLQLRALETRDSEGLFDSELRL